MADQEGVSKPSARHFYLSPYVLAKKDFGFEFKLSQAIEDLHLGLIESHPVVTIDRLLDVLDKIETQQPNLTKLIKNIDKVSQIGAAKYGIYSYKKGLKASNLMNAIFRHMIKIANGVYLDEESGLSHYYHIYANLLILLYNIQFTKDCNDLYKPSPEERSEK